MQDAAHKVMLLWKLAKKFNFTQARVIPVQTSVWAIAFARECMGRNYVPYHIGWARISKIGEDGKAHKAFTCDSKIGQLYRRPSNYPNVKSSLGLVSLMPTINDEIDLYGRAAILDMLVKMPHGFGWKKDRFFTREGEIEETLATYDLAVNETDASLEDGMVELIELKRLLNSTNELLKCFPEKS